eukprot:3192964-Pyramimonas_sp.AAC.1
MILRRTRRRRRRGRRRREGGRGGGGGGGKRGEEENEEEDEDGGPRALGILIGEWHLCVELIPGCQRQRVDLGRILQDCRE